MKRLNTLALIAGIALLVAMPFSLKSSFDGRLSLSLDRADARVGRPLTATSVAGVNRRVHRRAYRSTYGVGYGAGYPRGGQYYGRYYR